MTNAPSTFGVPGQVQAGTSFLGNSVLGAFSRPDFWQRVALGVIGTSLMITGVVIVVATSKAGKAVGGVVLDVAGVAATKNPVGAVASTTIKKVAT